MLANRKIIRSGLCSLLGLNSFACSPRDKLDFLEFYSKIPLKNVNQLQVNEENRYRTIIEEDEESGIGELRSLSMNPVDEEAWLYLGKEKIWVEVGKKATFRYVKLDVPYIISLINKFDDITFYHFHPSEIRWPFNVVQSTQEALPSSDDINNTIVGSVKFYGMHPNGRYRDRVCSLFGIVETSLTKEGIAYFSRRISEAEEYSGELRKKIDDCSTKSESPLKEIEEMIKRANSDKYIAFKFTPYLE